MFSLKHIKFGLILMFIAAMSFTTAAAYEHVRPFSLSAADIPIGSGADYNWGVRYPFNIRGDWTWFEYRVIPRSAYLYEQYVSLPSLRIDPKYAIREMSTRMRYSNYISSPDDLAIEEEPYTLYNLLYYKSHSLISIAEGTKFQFQVYRLLDEGVTNITSRGVISAWKEDGEAYDYFTPMIRLTGLEKPTEEDWKRLRMKIMFIFLADQKLKTMHSQF